MTNDRPIGDRQSSPRVWKKKHRLATALMFSLLGRRLAPLLRPSCTQSLELGRNKAIANFTGEFGSRYSLDPKRRNDSEGDDENGFRDWNHAAGTQNHQSYGQYIVECRYSSGRQLVQKPAQKTMTNRPIIRITFSLSNSSLVSKAFDLFSAFAPAAAGTEPMLPNHDWAIVKLHN